MTKSKRQYRITIALDPLERLEFENRVKAFRFRPGATAAILFLYGMEHANEAWQEFFRKGSERTRMRYDKEAHEEARQFMDEIAAAITIPRNEDTNG